MIVEGYRTLQLLHRLRDNFDEKKKRIESKWNGDEIIKEMANKIQEKVEGYKDINYARKDFAGAMNVYGRLFIEGDRPKKITDSEIFDIYSKVEGHKYEKTNEEQDIEFAARSINLETPEVENKKFREKSLEYIKNKIEEATLSYLFVVARQEFGAEPFDKDKQLRQIRAVYHMLAGDHVAMDTGDGKTSVVIPIFSLAKSLFTEVDRKHPDKPIPGIFLSGSDSKNTQEMREKVNEYTKYINVGIHNISDETTKKELSWRISLANVAPEYEGSSSQDPLLDKMTAQTPSLTWAKNLGANMGFIPHSDMVFETTREYTEAIDRSLPTTELTHGLIDRKKVLSFINSDFEKGQPTFVVDEVHLLTSPFTMETGRLDKDRMVLDLDQKEIGQRLCQYVAIRLFHEEIFGEEKVKLIVSEGGTLTLTKDGIKKISKLTRQWFDEIDRTENSGGNTSDIVKRIRKIVNEEIKPNHELNRKFSTKKLIHLFKETIDYKYQDEDFNNERKSYRSRFISEKKTLPYDGLYRSFNEQLNTMLISEYLKTIGSIEQGKDYITPDLLRDYLRGLLLPTHRYTSDVSFFLNALEGKPDLSQKRNLDYDINFYTWLALINRGNIITLSNDLFITDPDTGERSMSLLGKVLEAYTNGKVVDLAPKKTGEERLPIPIPIILPENASLTDKISADLLSGKRPEMLISWDEDTAHLVYKKLENSGKNVVIIDSQTDDKEADEYQRQFANNEIDILISTGRKSFAADFKDDQGRFTDFRVSVVDPDTLFQIGQAFGRRRLPKHVEDFSIFFTKDYLLELAESVLKQEQELPYFSSLLGRADPAFEGLQELLNKPYPTKEESAQIKSIMIDVLRKVQTKTSGDWERLVDNEVTFIQDIAPKIKHEKTKLFMGEVRNEKSAVNKLIKKELDKTTRKYHLSKAEVNKLRQIAYNVALNSFAQIEESMIQEFNYDSMFMTYNPTLSSSNTVIRGNLVRQFENKISTYAGDWKEEFNPKSYFMTQILRQQINEELSSYGRLLKQLPQILRGQNLSTSQVDDFHLLFAPPLEAGNGIALSKATAKSIKGAHGQTVGLKLKYGKMIRYLSSPTGDTWRQINNDQFELRLLVLNKLSKDFFKDKKFVDVYYQGEESTSMFLRVVLKK